MQVTKEGIERIKSSNPLHAVIAERGIDLKRKGRVLVARCPFHEERTASFTVTAWKGLYHCFGCGAAGDVIGFLTKHDKLSFRDALDVLARRAGLDLARLMEERPRTLQRTPLLWFTSKRDTPALSPRLKSSVHGKPDSIAASRKASMICQRARGVSTRHSPPAPCFSSAPRQ